MIGKAKCMTYKVITGFSRDCRCPRANCKHYEEGLSPGTDYCEGCVRGYLGMPDKFEPRRR